MRTFSAAVLGLMIVPSVTQAQSAGRSVLLPPNPIDRATAASDPRNADARRAAEADRRAAADSAAATAARTGPIPNSTMTDNPGGFSPAQETGSSIAPTTTPPRT